MGMEFMKRGMKRRAEEMKEAKEEWERDMEEMMRQRNSDEESEDEEKRKQSDEKKEEVLIHFFLCVMMPSVSARESLTNVCLLQATVKGRRTIDASQHGLALRAEAPAGPTEPVKFSGTTQQTVKASLSSGRTVKMSGHATIGIHPCLFRPCLQSAVNVGARCLLLLIMTTRAALGVQEGNANEGEESFGACHHPALCCGRVPRS